MKSKSLKSGFTLLEILLVVGIIAILAGIVIVAINPSKQLATVRNAERKSDIKQIDSALTQYYIDNFHYPTSLSSNLTEVCDTGSLASSSVEEGTCTGLINLSELVPTYITAIPKDPQASTTNGAGYSVVKDTTTGKIGLSAPAELGQTITIGVATSSTSGDGGNESLGISGLVAHWKMNDADCSNVVDSSGNGHNGSGSCTHTSDALVGGGALSFNGSSNQIDIPQNSAFDFSSSQDWTISFWTKSSSMNNGEAYLSMIGGGSWWQAYYDNTNYFIVAEPTDSQFWLPFNASSNTWYHIALVNDSGTLSYYLNHQLIESHSYHGSNIPADLFIGSDGSGGRYMNGILDDIRIYSKALSGSEIDQIWNGGDGTEAE